MEHNPISLFKGYADTRPTEVTLKNIVELIRNDASTAERTRKHRYYLQHEKATAAKFEKTNCPCFAVAVRFRDGRQKNHICGYTRLCLADFDHVPTERMKECMQLVRNDPHTLLAYTTISGTGLRVISAYTGQDREGKEAPSPNFLHACAFETVNRHYAKLLQHPYDPKCKNITRLSGLAHDPHVYFNPEATPFIVEVVPQQQQDSPAKALKKATRLIEHLLAEENVEYIAHNRNNYIMRTGYLLNAYGIPQEAATEWAMRRFADYDGDVAGIFRSCYLKTEEHGTRLLPGYRRNGNETEGRLATVAEIEEFLRTQGRFRKNTVTGRCEMAVGEGAFTEVTDRQVNTLWCRCSKEVKPTRPMDIRAVIESEFSELFNPFETYFRNLPPWDGTTDAIAQLAAQVHVKEDAALFALCFRKWLVALVAALLKPEVVNHGILVLSGRQGIYKTTWLNNLLPLPLRRYFYLKTNSRNLTKDDTLTLSEFAIVCLEELDEMESKEMNQLKALTTLRTVNERAAYAHYKESRPHIASFCGTSNNIHFLNDLSGNRRWMPFEVESIDCPYEHPVDYNAVYAQAYALVNEGYTYWLTPGETEALNRHNRHFEVPCLERELILTYYERPMPGATNAAFLTVAQILARINAGIRQKLSPVKVGMVMRQEGFEPMRVGGKRGYRVIELTGEQIEQRKRWVTHWQ